MNFSLTGIAWLKMNRPPVNSLNKQMLEELTKSVDVIENDESYKGIILTSVSKFKGIFTDFCVTQALYY